RSCAASRSIALLAMAGLHQPCGKGRVIRMKRRPDAPIITPAMNKVTYQPDAPARVRSHPPSLARRAGIGIVRIFTAGVISSGGAPLRLRSGREPGVGEHGQHAG